ncbi:MAG: hypothetical protein VBE63_06920 [Lamprobacter sp.]|uniref:hypothetical protein n=1 Tax=Lamprobacter sp. TaxID=3100796 RepID=UPI002B25A27F|nr:hypothetical protein [Lamprobacter sp.]MEA3639660.1 hypothetical protein [Lamprobacter sp.]
MSVTRDEILNLFQEIALQSKETDRKLQKTALQQKKTDRQVWEANKALGRQCNRLGEFVEERMRPGVG